MVIAGSWKWVYFCTRFRINRHRGHSHSDLFVFPHLIEPADTKSESAFGSSVTEFFHYFVNTLPEANAHQL